jgi:poly(A) polymerase
MRSRSIRATARCTIRSTVAATSNDRLSEPSARARTSRGDPLRLLRARRAVRASRLGFEIEASTAEAIGAASSALASISRERVRDELDKLLLGPAPGRGIALLCDLGLAEHSLPDVPKLCGMEQKAGRHKDVFSHTLQVLDRAPPRLALRWAALLHDIAKPATKRVENGHVTFHGHDHKGERMARTPAMQQPNEWIRRARLVGLHLRKPTGARIADRDLPRADVATPSRTCVLSHAT